MNAVATPQRTLFSVEQFHLMAAAGVFAPGARIELIDGELLNMAPIGSRQVLGPDRAATLTALPSAALAWGRAVSAQ